MPCLLALLLAVEEHTWCTQGSWAGVDLGTSTRPGEVSVELSPSCELSKARHVDDLHNAPPSFYQSVFTQAAYRPCDDLSCGAKMLSEPRLARRYSTFGVCQVQEKASSPLFDCQGCRLLQHRHQLQDT